MLTTLKNNGSGHSMQSLNLSIFLFISNTKFYTGSTPPPSSSESGFLNLNKTTVAIHTSLGPSIVTWKYRRLSLSGSAWIPGTGSDIKRCVSYKTIKTSKI